MTRVLELPRRPRRRRWVWGVTGVLALLVAATLAWFQPQKLLYGHRVDEGLPAVAGAASGAPAAQPMELASGTFVSREHPTHGTARVLRLADGRVVVRFEDFATSNGPVLVVQLSTGSAIGEDAAFQNDHVDLGPLKGTAGDQNYVLPAGLDSAAYTSVVVWCDRFDVAFGAADLHPSL